ncbi:putative pentatricopeptide repeat-containing protein at3g05240 [Phtheirospermum japonicum]|uniref:Putative pentatricopeptide repeat-containing protein at3g05240 n=1 Tax=Phtheirospermum japonicum TaxID=374723 RepID=A0A830CEP4_9LAMI|nr:putative pentatricopeptide repeat-containing protein at3g05240 [Phtheirospermum japonicum]
MRRVIPFYNDPFIYASVIKACNKARASLEGKSIHCRVIRVGLDYNVNVLNSLVSFYMGSVNSMSYAAMVFDKVPGKSVVTVNCMISGNINRGNLDVGVSLFGKMLSGCYGSNVKANYVTFVILISGCVKLGGFRTGNALHSFCGKMGLDRNLEICNALIDLYSKSGCIFDAASVFREMTKKDIISWNSMICGYASGSDFAQSLSLLREMRIANVGVDEVSFSCLLSVCAARKDLYLGRMIHAHVKSNGLECDVSIGTALINMYARCGKLESARKEFDEMPKQIIEYWNAMIHSYIENGISREALKLLDQVKFMDLEPDEVTILGLIMTCRDTGDLHQGILVHSVVESKECFKRNVVLGNALIDMYAKCGSMTKARAVFDTISKKDVVSWTSMIVGHAINGEGDKSLATFKLMCAENFVPNSITFIGVLSACDHAGLVHEGRKLYNTMFEVYNIKPWIEHCGCVVDMLARAGKMEDAQIFIGQMPMEPNALVWRMLMNGCRVHGHINLGLDLVASVKELNASSDSADFVISSNIYAEAGRWGDVVSRRNLMVSERTPKVAGKSSVSYLTE